MSKTKSAFVTGLVAVMLGIIIFAAYRLYMIAFVVIVGILAVYGFINAAEGFAFWLRGDQDKALDPPVIISEADLLPEDFTFTYDDIKQEVDAGV